MTKRFVFLISTCILLLFSGICCSAVNPITITFANGTTDFISTESGTANYVVSVNSGIPPNIPLTLSLSSIGCAQGLNATQITSGVSPCAGVGTLCGSSFSLTAGQRCCLSLALNSPMGGSFTLRPIVSTIPPAYSAQATSDLLINVTPIATLSVNVSRLALAVNCLPSSTCTGVQNAALTGNPRQLVITNQSTTVAENVSYSVSPALPPGTFITPFSCGTILSGASCILTVTPGSTPSATPYNRSPVPVTLTVTGSNTTTVSSALNILTYGSVYQSGYVYALYDNYLAYPINTSVGGKVVILDSQTSPEGIRWSSDGAGGTAYNSIWGIAENSTPASPFPNNAQSAILYPGQFNCQGNIDGTCDTNNIFQFYQNPAAFPNAPVSRTLYAAGLCTLPIAGFTDWYLPAICELGPNIQFCPASEQNMVNNLSQLIVNSGGSNICPFPGCFPGDHWSSTEASLFPLNSAWVQNFFPLASTQSFTGKQATLLVRCSRLLIP